jgi:hypothetical protein
LHGHKYTGLELVVCLFLCLFLCLFVCLYGPWSIKRSTHFSFISSFWGVFSFLIFHGEHHFSRVPPFFLTVSKPAETIAYVFFVPLTKRKK